MCERWRNSFVNFLADMGECPNGLTLGRIDNDKGYEPSNCEWQSWHKQFRNKSNNFYVWHNGEKMIITDFAALMGVPRTTLYYRMKKGRTAHEAVADIRAERSSHPGFRVP